MPRFDQMGPMGQGSMTGKRMGRCTNFGAGRNRNGNTEEDAFNQYAEDRRPLGGDDMRIGGRGMRMGRGMGRGRGIGRNGQI